MKDRKMGKKPRATVLLVDPLGHVNEAKFRLEINGAKAAGLNIPKP